MKRRYLTLMIWFVFLFGDAFSQNNPIKDFASNQNEIRFENIIEHKTGYFYKNHIYKKFRLLEPAFQDSALEESFYQYVKKRKLANGLGTISLALMASGFIISSVTGIGYVDCERDCGSETGPIIFLSGIVIGPIAIISTFGLKKRRKELLKKHKLMVEELVPPKAKEISLRISFTSTGPGFVLSF